MLMARIILIVVVALSSVYSGASTVTAQGEQESQSVIERAIQLSQYEEAGDTRALYRYMHPHAKAVVPFSAMDGWYTNEFFPLQPGAITTIVSVEYVTWIWGVTGQSYENTAEITYVQPFGAPGSTTETQETVRLVKDHGSWKWFFGRSQEFVDEQIRKYPDESQRDQPVLRTSRSEAEPKNNNNRVEPRSDQTAIRTSRSSSKSGSSKPKKTQDSVPGVLSASVPRDCTLVELYPGYPLYRGNITGVMGYWQGLGDFQCLEDLEETYPRFEKNQEDSANKAAARAIGITGDPHQWTWENWMLIESHRGLPPSCYSCLIIDQTNSPIMTNLEPDPRDSRIRIGFFGDESSLRRIIVDHGRDGGMWTLLDSLNSESYELRAIAYSYNTSANADEILSRYDEIFAFLFSVGDQIGPPMYAVSTDDYLYWVLWETGGYTRVPEAAHPGDQIFLLSFAVFAIDNRMTDSGDSFLHGHLERGVQAWIDVGYPDSLAQFLRERGYFIG